MAQLPPLNKTPIDLIRNTIQDRKYQPLEDFEKLHTVVRWDDANGNGDDVFNGANVKTIERNWDRHGYDNDQDKAVYDYHNEDVLDALMKMRNAVRGTWKEYWGQVGNQDTSGNTDEYLP